MLAFAAAPLARAQPAQPMDPGPQHWRYDWLSPAATGNPVVVPGDNDRPGPLLTAAPLAQHPVPEQSAAADLAEARVRKSVADLARAEKNLRDGKQPRPDERQHLVDGHSRLRQAYFDRIDALERAVTRARREVADAGAARDALLP